MRYITWIIINTLALGLVLTACHRNAGAPAARDFPVSLDSAAGSCPYLTRTPDGGVVLSWVRRDPEGTMVWYAIFDDSTRHFGVPHPIPPTRGVEPHGENMPKLVFARRGEILAMYGVKSPQPDNPYTGTVYYSWSADKGKHWTMGKPLFTSARSYDQRYFDIALLPSGEVGAVWLNNSRKEGSTLYFAATEPGGTFGPARIVAKHTCQCCRTDLLADSTGLLHVAWRAIIDDSIRDMAYCYSRDTGKTFSAPVRISRDNWVIDGCPHTGPTMTENTSGLHFAWFTMGGGGGVYYCNTEDSGRLFSPRQPVSREISARHPQLAALPSGNLAVVWDEGTGAVTARHQRIGLEMRGPAGLALSSRHVSSDSTNAYFPQIAVLNNTRALVAYTEDGSGGEQVSCRLVSLQP